MYYNSQFTKKMLKNVILKLDPSWNIGRKLQKLNGQSNYLKKLSNKINEADNNFQSTLHSRELIFSHLSITFQILGRTETISSDDGVMRSDQLTKETKINLGNIGQEIEIGLSDPDKYNSS
jgi:hypothetical protein